jgi:hypothetical protein
MGAPMGKKRQVEREVRFLRLSDDGRVVTEIPRNEQEPLNWDWILTHLNQIDDILYQLEKEGWHAKCHSWSKPVTISVSRPIR